MSHPMTNSMWVTLLYCSLINHVSSHDQQQVSDTALSCSLINHVSSHDQQGVSDTALLQSHQSCLISWPTACEWHHGLYCSLINHVSSHDQQAVSDTALLHFHQSCLIPWPTGCEWHCLIAVSSLMSHPMTNSLWVTLLDSDARQSHQCSFCDQQGGVSDTVLCPPLYHPIHDQQVVSPVKVSTTLFHSISYDEQQVTVSDMPSLPVTSLHMINSRWVTVHLLSCYDLISWLPTASGWSTT